MFGRKPAIKERKLYAKRGGKVLGMEDFLPVEVNIKIETFFYSNKIAFLKKWFCNLPGQS